MSTEKENLAHAFEVASYAAGSVARIALAHAFVCHSDGSECHHNHGEHTCKADRKLMHLIDFASDSFENGDDFAEFVAMWKGRSE